MSEQRTISDLPLFAQARTAPPPAAGTMGERPREPQAAPPVQPPCNTDALPPPPEFDRVVQVLSSHLGAHSAITAYGIAEHALINPAGTRGSRERHVRELLEIHLEHLPWPLVADANGFYRPLTSEELQHYWANLHSRAMCLFIRLRTLRRLATRAGFEYHGRGRWADPQPPGGVPSASAH